MKDNQKFENTLFLLNKITFKKYSPKNIKSLLHLITKTICIITLIACISCSDFDYPPEWCGTWDEPSYAVKLGLVCAVSDLTCYTDSKCYFDESDTECESRHDASALCHENGNLFCASAVAAHFICQKLEDEN